MLSLFSTNDRNGGRLRLNASRHDDDDDDNTYESMSCRYCFNLHFLCQSVCGITNKRSFYSRFHLAIVIVRKLECLMYKYCTFFANTNCYFFILFI